MFSQTLNLNQQTPLNLKMKTTIFVFSFIAITIALDRSDFEKFKTGNNLLTSDIYKVLTEKFDSNFLVSPFSAERVLALAAAGAKGQTAEELRLALRLPEANISEEVFSNSFKSDEYVFESANKIYVKENFEIREDFKKTATDVYQADLQNIDFSDKKKATEEINSWVKAQTRDKIRDIISEGSLSEATKLVLINALYFKGNWSSPFKLRNTALEEFYSKEKEVVKVDTMHITENFNYYECAEVDAKFLELPFRAKNTSMTIVLPNDKNGILNLENQIDKVFTPRNYTEEFVQVALPKFKIETSIDFTEILKKLGVKEAFGGNNTDFSGISGTPGLCINSVFQKTFIDVSEEGVEAAAATLTLFQLGIPSVAQTLLRKPKPFIVDHPFIFYIKVEGVVLFGGRVLAP